MKILTLIILLAPFYLLSQNVGIGTNNPDVSAKLEVQSTNGGVLIPRLTSTERDAIPSPASGLLVYNSENNQFEFYNGGSWGPIASASSDGSEISDADDDTKVSTETSIDEDKLRFTAAGNEIVEMDAKTIHVKTPQKSTYIGEDAGSANITTLDNWNTHLGYKSGEKGTNGERNTLLGAFSGGNKTTLGDENVMVGLSAGYDNEGNNNTFIGRDAGRLSGSGSDNTYLGHGAGRSAIGSGNVMLGHDAGKTENADNKLYISNNDLNPLIYGEFDNSKVFINRKAGVTIAEVFGVRANTDGFGGMYMETQGLDTGKPFYGFAVNGSPQSYIYHDGANDEMRFYNNSDRLAIKNSGKIRINNQYELPSEDGDSGQVMITDGLGNLNWGSKAAPILEDSDSDTRITVEQNPDEDKIRLVTGGHTSMIIDSVHLDLSHPDSSLFIGLNAGNQNNKNLSVNNQDGRYNTFIGLNSGKENGINISVSGCSGFNINNPMNEGGCGSHNTFLGANSGIKNQYGRNNLFIGSHSGYHTNPSSGFYSVGEYGYGSDNIYLGFSSGFQNRSGYRNTFLGTYAGQNNGINQDGEASNGGFDNTFIGSRAGMFNENGKENVFVGTLSGGDFNNEEGKNNTFLGFKAGFKSDGNNNVYIGSQSGSIADASPSALLQNNVMVGANTGFFGDGNYTNNTIIGFEAAKFLDGSNNIAIGAFAAFSGFDGDNRLIIGSTDGGNLPVIYGELDNKKVAINWDHINDLIPQTFSVNGNASKSIAGDWLANSDKRLKKNITPLESEKMLEKLLLMKGVSYEWNDTITGFDRPENIQYGFIAQDIEKVWPENIEKDKKGYLMTAYGTYDHMYVEAIKALYDEINELKEHILKLENKIEKSSVEGRASSSNSLERY